MTDTKDQQGDVEARGVPSETNSTSYMERVLAELRSSTDKGDQSGPRSPLSRSGVPSVPFETLMQRQRVRTQELNNDKKARENNLISQNQALKQLTLILLFVLLFLETAVLFVLAFFQGLATKGFALDVWTLRVLVVATLIQISAMLTIAVRHLFPSK